MRPLQGRESNATLSGGVAPGYFLVPLQGEKEFTFGYTPGHPVSDITVSPPPAIDAQIATREDGCCNSTPRIVAQEEFDPIYWSAHLGFAGKRPGEADS